MQRNASGLLTLALTVLSCSAAVGQSIQYGEPLVTPTSTAYPNGEFAAHLSAARGEPASGACDWGWGCGGSPYRTGPGLCDNWRVGPRWSGSVDGVFLFRNEIDLPALAAAATAGGIAINPAAPDTYSFNIDHGIGSRLTLAGHWPQCRNFELQLGYVGVFGWNAEVFDPEVPYSGPLPNPPAVNTQKLLSYRSELHSLEVNAQQVTEGPIRFFSGFRYWLLNEDVDDKLDESQQPPLIPPNADDMIVGDPPLDVTDIRRSIAIDNNLIGLQAGMRSDFLTITDRLYLQGFASGGIYCNYVRRESEYLELRTYNALNDPSTVASEAVFNQSTVRTGYDGDAMRGAFAAEALLGAVYEVNRCTDARIGYQVLYLTGVELGPEAFRGNGPTGADLLLHGWFAGVECRR